MEEAGPSITEKPTDGSVHLHLDLENDDDDMMLDASSVRVLDQPFERYKNRQMLSAAPSLIDIDNGDAMNDLRFALSGLRYLLALVSQSFWDISLVPRILDGTTNLCL
ncbi:hypothetical protein Tco_0666254 [Tanacetum coccineum]